MYQFCKSDYLCLSLSHYDSLMIKSELEAREVREQIKYSKVFSADSKVFVQKAIIYCAILCSVKIPATFSYRFLQEFFVLKQKMISDTFNKLDNLGLFIKSHFFLGISAGLELNPPPIGSAPAAGHFGRKDTRPQLCVCIYISYIFVDIRKCFFSP